MYVCEHAYDLALESWKLSIEGFVGHESLQQERSGGIKRDSGYPPDSAQVCYSLACALKDSGNFLSALEPASMMLERATAMLDDAHQTVL